MSRVKKKLTRAAAKKRSVRNRGGKKAVKRAGYGKTMKAKSGKKVKKAQVGKVLKKIANNKKVLSRMKKSKKGPKLTPEQKQEILESYRNVGDTKAIRAKRKIKTKKLSREEELSNSYNTTRRVKPKSKMKKATYGKTMKAKKAKAGLKTPKASQKGLKMLPTAVRNKMGYAKKGKTVKKAGYGTKAKKAKSGCSTRRKKK